MMWRVSERNCSKEINASSSLYWVSRKLPELMMNVSDVIDTSQQSTGTRNETDNAGGKH